MKSLLRTTFFSALLCGALMMPSVSSAHQSVAIRSDGTLQSAYSMRGHWIFVNRVSRRHMRNRTLVERANSVEWLQKEII